MWLPLPSRRTGTKIVARAHRARAKGGSTDVATSEKSKEFRKCSWCLGCFGRQRIRNRIYDASDLCDFPDDDPCRHQAAGMIFAQSKMPL